MCVMPCYDKKLEASRSEFRLLQGAGGEGGEETREVDLVLSAAELLELAGKVLPDIEQLRSIPRGAVEGLSGESREPQVLAALPEWGTAGTSGGFAEYVFQHVAKHVLGRDVRVIEAGAGVKAGGDGDVAMMEVEGSAQMEGVDVCQWKQGRNSDIHELSLEVETADGDERAGGERGKQVVLKVARCYGFRNIQNVTRQLKSAKGCGYDFVEVMACPSGCINGGGQLRVPDGSSETPKARLARVLEVFNKGQRLRCPWDNDQAPALYASFIGAEPNSAAAAVLLHTSYKPAQDPSASNPIGIQW